MCHSHYSEYIWYLRIVLWLNLTKYSSFSFHIQGRCGVEACHTFDKQEWVKHINTGWLKFLDVYEPNGVKTTKQMDIAIWSR